MQVYGKMMCNRHCVLQPLFFFSPENVNLVKYLNTIFDHLEVMELKVKSGNETKDFI